MKTEREQEFMDELSRQFHRDRIFLNNPVVMQGMGLAPLVIVATSVENALMLAVAVALLLTPSRVIASLAFGRVKSHLWRAIGYTGIVAVLYAGVYYLLSLLFGVKILNLGIYLPILVVEPLLIYRFARTPETMLKAFVKGLKTTLGYGMVLAIVGCLREVLALGTLYGMPVVPIAALPIASTPAGGLILLGVICAIWRTATNVRRKKLVMEARYER